MSSSATLHVSPETRERLATVAAARGTSITELVATLATREYLHVAYAQERKAWRQDLENPEAIAEIELWDEAASDYLD